MKTTRFKLTVLGLLLATLAAPAAWANGQSAVHQLYVNLQRSGGSIDLRENAARTTPTLVLGIYRMADANGRFFGYINEAGTLFGDSRGFTVVAGGAPPRPMQAAEQAELRAELMRNIDRARLIKVTYGKGSEREILMFSAVDCPYCKRLEDGLQGLGDKVDATLYVLPASLQSAQGAPSPAWQAATQIWCADDNGLAWKKFWSTRAVPPARNCEITPRSASLAETEVRDLLIATGAKLGGYPTLVREDGNRLAHPNQVDAAWAQRALGTAGKPAVAEGGKWLIAAADAGGDAPTAVPGATAGAPAQIDLNKALKKIFK